MTSLSSEFAPWNLLFLSLETGNKNSSGPLIVQKRHAHYMYVSFFIAQYFVEVGRSKG